MISVVTVPKTGTIYTMRLLRGWGVKYERTHLRNTDAPPYGGERFGPGFPCPSTDEWATYPDTRRIVCTLRDPILAVISELNRGVPDRMISVDGWGVMADWHERQIPTVHFFPIPPTGVGLAELAKFVGARGGWMASHEPRNTSEDPDGLRALYRKGVLPNHPTIKRAIQELDAMPLVWKLFDDHGITLPKFGHGEIEEANHNNREGS